MKMNLPVLFLLVFAVSAARAEETPVYESLASIDIGRVFYTESERRDLDKNRSSGKRRTAAAGTRRTGREPVRDHPDAAGYIISASGQSRIWKKGDFVKSSDADVDDVTFPGKVRIEVHDNAADNE